MGVGFSGDGAVLWRDGEGWSPEEGLKVKAGVGRAVSAREEMKWGGAAAAAAAPKLEKNSSRFFWCRVF